MGDALDITVRRERGVVIAAVTGDIDISTVARLRECLFELADSGRTLIVDLNRVTFIDSSGLGALIGAARRADAHGGSLHAVCARPPDPQAVVADRGGPPDSVGRHRGRGADVPGGVPGRSRLVPRGAVPGRCAGRSGSGRQPRWGIKATSSPRW